MNLGREDEFDDHWLSVRVSVGEGVASGWCCIKLWVGWSWMVMRWGVRAATR